MNHPIVFLDWDNKTKLVPAFYFDFYGVLFTLLFPKIVENSRQENLKVIKNTLLNKSGNPKSLIK